MKDSSKFATKNYSARLFLLLYVLTVTAFSIFVGVGFAVAAVACALTRRAPLWLLGFLGGVGIVLVLMGIYFRVTQPDGILTGYLIPIGFGFFLAEAAVAIERYWHRRH